MPQRSSRSPPATNSYKRLVPDLKRRLTWPTPPVTVRGRGAHSDVFDQSQAEAVGVPSARSFMQCLLAFSRCDGRFGRRAKSDRSSEPLDKDIYDLSPEELKNVPSLPGSLTKRCRAEADRDFLLRRCIHSPADRPWVSYKREREIQPLRCGRTRWNSALLRITHGRTGDAPGGAVSWRRRDVCYESGSMKLVHPLVEKFQCNRRLLLDGVIPYVGSQCSAPGECTARIRDHTDSRRVSVVHTEFNGAAHP